MRGEMIDGAPLVVQRLRTFVDTDRAVQVWRYHTNGAPTGAAAGTGNGTGAESRNG